MEAIRAAIIGTGRIASLLEDDPRREKPASHAGALAANRHCQLVGGADTCEERREQFTHRWGVPSFASPEELLRTTSPQILVVATHPDSHARYVSMAAKHRVAVVVCEKPLAHTRKDSRTILRLERRRGVRLVVNHERRFSRDYQLVRQAVASRHFGELLGVSGVLYFGGAQRLDRVFLHDGTHLVDAIHFITDDRITRVHCSDSLRKNTGSAVVHGTLRRRGIPVSLEVGAQRRYLHLVVRLSFSAGEIEVGNGVFRWRRAMESPHYEGFFSLQEIPRSVPEPTGYFSGMVAEAVRLIHAPESTSRSTACDAWHALKVIRQATGPLHRLRPGV